MTVGYEGVGGEWMQYHQCCLYDGMLPGLARQCCHGLRVRKQGVHCGGKGYKLWVVGICSATSAASVVDCCQGWPCNAAMSACDKHT
jgi:hypothetical protein